MSKLNNYVAYNRYRSLVVNMALTKQLYNRKNRVRG